MGIILLIIFFPLIILGICLIAMGGFAAKESYEKNNVTKAEKEKLISAIQEKRKETLESHNIQQFKQSLKAATYEDLFGPTDKLHIAGMESAKKALQQATQLIASEVAVLDKEILTYNLKADSIKMSWDQYSPNQIKISPKFSKNLIANIDKTITLPDSLYMVVKYVFSNEFWHSIIVSRGFDAANRYSEDLYKTIQESFSKEGITFYVSRKTAKSSILYEAIGEWFWKHSILNHDCYMAFILNGEIRGRCTRTSRN